MGSWYIFNMGQSCHCLPCPDESATTHLRGKPEAVPAETHPKVEEPKAPKEEKAEEAKEEKETESRSWKYEFFWCLKYYDTFKFIVES